jgi:acylphosphatase
MEEATQRQLHAVISGRVQGVDYRQYVLHHACRLGLVGYVRNNRDRTVEVIAEGPPIALTALIEQLRIGPAEAVVRSVDSTFGEISGHYSRFSINI